MTTKHPTKYWMPLVALITLFLLIPCISAQAATSDEWFIKGNNLLRTQDYQNAIIAYTHAITMEPRSIGSYTNRGLANAALGKFDAAISDYSSALSLNPKHISAYNNRALVYDKKGMYIQALGDLNKALTINPNFLPAYDNRATVYNHQGKFDLAIKDCNKALSIDPNVADVYHVRGESYRLQGKFDLALQDYNKALSIDPKLADAYVGRGNLFISQGLLQQADKEFIRAKILDPHSLDQTIKGPEKSANTPPKISSEISEEDYFVAGLSLGMTKQKMFETLGLPTSESQKTIDYFAGGRNVSYTKYIFPGIAIGIIDDRDFIVDIVLLDTTYKTARGITIGDPYAKVKELYSQKFKTFPSNTFEYRMKRTAYAIDFKVDPISNKIKGITIHNWGD